jgi:hypothetical protein
MDLKPAAPIHFYDTLSHAIACGVRGPDHRSTKHPRQVTCEACVAMRSARQSLAGLPGREVAAGVAGP